MGNHILKIGNLKKTIRYLRKNGLKHAFYAAKERIEEEKTTEYAYREPKEEELLRQRTEWKRFPYRFSIVVPAYETKEAYLRQLIDSVRRQSYERWELIIADAGAGNRVEEVVSEYQEKKGERRLRYIRLLENGGISENTNAGIEAAKGDYIGLLDHDDSLAPDALYEMAAAIDRAEQNKIKPVFLYSDEDKFDDNRCYKSPNFKDKFNFDLILSNNYICHFMMVAADDMKKLKLRKKYDGAQDYDLVLRLIHQTLAHVPASGLAERFIHVPRVLYHWRCHEQSTADNTASKTYAYEAGKEALEEFCISQGWNVHISHALHLGFYRIEYLPDMFEVRSDVGVIGGRVLCGNRIKAGMYDEAGNKVYEGLHKEYSGGSTHRAALMQDCAAVDIRCLRVCGRLRTVFREITGVPYREAGEWKTADISGISCDEEGYRKLSLELGRAARRLGYQVVWNPEITVRDRNSH